MADSAVLTLKPAVLGATAAGASVALVVVDDDCRVAEASVAGCRLLGTRRSELIDRPLADTLTPAAADRLVRVWDAFSETGGHAGPFALSAPNGSDSIDINVTAAVVPGRHLVLLSTTGTAGSRATASALTLPRSGARTPTSRERQILAMLAEGDTDAQVAAQLGLSPATVQTHVRNAKAKLGARTRAQAVALALRQGLIEPES